MTDDEVLASTDWLARATEVLTAGGADVALHLRGPGTPARALLELADGLLPVARNAGARLLVNDRVDVALVANLDGVQLGGASLAPGAARAVVGPDAWIGVSCHGPDDVVAAAAQGADYAFLGTIFPTPSHPDRTGIGLSGLADVVARSPGVPLIAIGGIGAGEAADVAAAGAHGVAAIRGIWSAPDPAGAVRQYLDGLGTREGEDLGSDGIDSYPPER